MIKFTDLKPDELGKLLATGGEVHKNEKGELFVEELKEDTRLKIARDKYFSADRNDYEPVQVTEEDIKKFNEDANNTELQRAQFFK